MTPKDCWCQNLKFSLRTGEFCLLHLVWQICRGWLGFVGLLGVLGSVDLVQRVHGRFPDPCTVKLPTGAEVFKKVKVEAIL